MSLHVPHIVQREESDCLVACVAMIFQYWDIRIEYGEIAGILDTQSYGTSGRRLLNLRSENLIVRYREGTMHDLEQHLAASIPCIALVHTAELDYWAEATNHAVVVSGITDTEAYLHDAAFETGPQIVPLASFELAWMDFDYRFAVFLPRDKMNIPRA